MKNSDYINCNDKEAAQQGSMASRAAWIDSRIPVRIPHSRTCDRAAVRLRAAAAAGAG